VVMQWGRLGDPLECALDFEEVWLLVLKYIYGLVCPLSYYWLNFRTRSRCTRQAKGTYHKYTLDLDYPELGG